MSLQAAIDGPDGLPFLRAEAESLMRSTCTVDRRTESWNGTKTVVSWTPVQTDLPCRVALPSVASRALVTDEAVTSEQPVIKVPHDTTGIEPDDRVTLADGRVAWVVHAPRYDDMVQVRLVCRWQQ